MREQLVKRLEALRAEFDSGQRMLAELMAEETDLRNTLTRIGGAIQVLEEELAKAEEDGPAKPAPVRRTRKK